MMLKQKNNLTAISASLQRISHIQHNKKSDLFSSFSYVDHVTYGSMRFDQENKEKPKKTKVESSLLQCLDLFKATRKFHLSSFQEKNYKRGKNKNCQKLKENKEKISMVRVNTDKKENLINKEGLRKYLSGEESFLEKQTQQKKMKKTFMDRRQKMGKIDKKLQEKGEEMDLRKTRGRWEKLQKIEKELDEEIIPSMQNHIKFVIQENNQYLVKPQKFYPKLEKSKERTMETKSLSYNYQISDLKFKEPSETPLLKKLKGSEQKIQEKHEYRLTSGKKDLFQLIKRGEYFAVQIQLSVKSSLLTLKDKKGNNLLHMCIFQNQADIFEMIVKKSIENDINLLKMENKYRRNPEEMGHLLGFFKRKSTLEAIEASKKHFEFEIAFQVFRNFS